LVAAATSPEKTSAALTTSAVTTTTEETATITPGEITILLTITADYFMHRLIIDRRRITVSEKQYERTLMLGKRFA